MQLTWAKERQTPLGLDCKVVSRLGGEQVDGEQHLAQPYHLFSYSRYSAFVHLSLATVDPWLDLDSTGTWLSSQQRACSEKGSNWSFF